VLEPVPPTVHHYGGARAVAQTCAAVQPADAAPGSAAKAEPQTAAVPQLPPALAQGSVAFSVVERGLVTFCNSREWTKQAAARGAALSLCTRTGPLSTQIR
jgi:hypothetical protein